MARTQQNETAEIEEIRESLHRRMLSSVSHDLKTPLATIIGSLEIFQRMQQKLSVEKQESLINSALLEAYRLDSFITNILDMAKLEEGTVVPQPEWADVTYIINDCIARLGPKRLSAEIAVRGENADAAKKVFVDATLLGRAVSLVLDNAIRHGGATPIEITYGNQDAGTSFIRIRDNGPGIPAGKEQDIFSKYTRFGRGDYQNAGTGLGLPACRLLMRLLGGSVVAANHSAGGAEFTLSHART